MAIQATSEEQLRLRKRARQRLLGAGALLLTAAIVLPMVLDQSPRQLDADVVIDMGDAEPPAQPAIPTQPTPIQTVPDAPLVATPPVDNKLSAIPAVPKVDITAPVLPAENKPRPDHKAETHTNDHTNDVAQPVNVKPSVQVHVDTPKVVIKPKPETQTESKIAKPEVKAAVKVEPKPQPVIQPKVSESATHDVTPPRTQHYVVQLGAFSNAENVQQLRDRLSAVGVSTYTEKLPNGATRVRVGPYTDKAQADKALAKVSAAGVQAQIVPLK